MGPDVMQRPLLRADGSALYSDQLYTVIAGINGPIDVQRRDELPEEAAIEVNLRPSTGVGGPRERWLESVLHSVLRSFLLVHMHPRTLFQITLQLTKEPNTKLAHAACDVAIVPTLVNAAFLALADSGLPLVTTVTAALAVVDKRKGILVGPNEKDISQYESIHAMAFDKDGEQILDQSAGKFDFDTWDAVTVAVQQACCAAMARKTGDAPMTDGVNQDDSWLSQALESQAMSSLSQRNST